MRLPATRTTLNAAEVFRLFQTTLVNAQTPLATLKAATPIFMAQSALETAHWNKMYCYGFGNVRSSRSWQGDFCQISGNEVIGGKVVPFSPPPSDSPRYNDPADISSFRAFTSGLAGATDYIRFVKTHYPEAYAAATAGDAAGYVHGLKQRSYFTADEALYLHAVLSMVPGFAKALDGGMYASPPIDWEAMRLQRNAQSYLDTAWDRLDLTHTSDDYDPTADK